MKEWISEHQIGQLCADTNPTLWDSVLSLRSEARLPFVAFSNFPVFGVDVLKKHMKQYFGVDLKDENYKFMPCRRKIILVVTL
jgi:hypothetical protein